MRETLLAWWSALRWVLKNFRQASKLKDPVDVYPLRLSALFVLLVFGNCGIALLAGFVVPSPLNLIVLLGILLGGSRLLSLINCKFRTDWFDQHYEIRKRQREIET